MEIIIYIICIYATITFNELTLDKRDQLMYVGAHNFDGVDVAAMLRPEREVVPIGNENETSCETSSCRGSAAKILAMMDTEVDPCEDFHSFVCGGKSSYNPKIQELRNLENTLQYLKKKESKNSEKFLRIYKTFYDSCLEHTNKYHDILTKPRQFKGAEMNASLTEVVRELIITQSLPMFDVGLGIDKDQNYILELTLLGSSSLKSGLNSWSVMEQFNEQCSETIWAACSSNISSLSDVYDSIKSCVKDNLKDHLKLYTAYMGLLQMKANPDMQHLLNTLLDYLPPANEIELTTAMKIHETMSLEDLSRKFNLVDWQKLTEGILPKRTFDRSIKVHVYFESYFSNLFKFLGEKYKPEELSAILIDYNNFQIFINTILPKLMENREIYCINLSNELMPDVATVIAYDQMDQETFNTNMLRNAEIQNRFSELKDVLRVTFDNATLEDGLKISFKDALKNINIKIISTGNTNSSKENYENIRLNRSNFHENLDILHRNFRRMMFSLVDTKASSGSLLNYFLSPSSNQPKLYYGTPYIVYHPAIFRDTLMDPEYIAISKIGMQIARELVRNFDLVSVIHKSIDIRLFYEKLTTRTNSLLYTLVKDTDINLEIFNNTLLINEMIIDNAAFKIVYAYFMRLEPPAKLPWISERYTNSKIFFSSIAQEYCAYSLEAYNKRDLLERGKLPPGLKIHNIVGNSEQFSESFNCPDGSRMLVDSFLRTHFPNDEVDQSYEYP